MNINSNGSPRVLGVYLGHDLGACLLINGQIVTMIEEERLNRFKHGRPNSVAGLWPLFAGKFGYFPWASVQYCLAASNLGIDDLDLLIVGDEIWGSGMQDTLNTVIPIRDPNKAIFTTEPQGSVHHYHHALSAFFSSPFDTAAVLVVDADGSSNIDGYEAESGYFFPDRSGRYEVVFKNRYRSPGIPKDGIGWMYEQITRLLGFYDESIFLADAGKTMGLAAYGKPRAELANPWIEFNGFKLDFTAFRTWLIESGYDNRILHNPMGLARRKPLPQLAADLASKAQAELERAMSHLVHRLHKASGASNLCLAGGVALNSVANGLLAANGPFERVFVQPAANDGGQAIGLAYHGHLLLNQASSQPSRKKNQSLPTDTSEGKARIKPMSSAFGGRRYCDHEIRSLLERGKFFYEELPPESLAGDAAKELSRNEFIGWFQSGSEFGPRALGHRSILADPRGPNVKDLLNSRVKFRESFRPFAPSVLAEKTNDVFELSTESPYMLLVAPVKEHWRELVPAIVHADGSARIQTVNKETDSLFHELIREFWLLTDVPLVLNTSFNLRGMPVVESPLDALQCFLFTELRYLYLENFKLAQPSPESIRVDFAPGVEFSFQPLTQAQTRMLVVSGERPGQRIEIEAPEFAISLLESFRNVRSVSHAYLKATQTSGHQNSVDEAVNLIKALLRAGALRLHVGDISFDGFWRDVPWWQV
jgi:carbamoyltransferase